MPPRRHQGYTVRRLRSGRWQAVVKEDGVPVGIGSYATYVAAERAAARAATEISAKSWIDPRRSDVPLREYMDDWLRRKTVTGDHGEKYRASALSMVRVHIYPKLGQVLLTDLQPRVVNRWYSDITRRQIAKLGAPGLVPAKTYRLLSACLADAVRDELLIRNPCIKKGAGAERSPERPLLTPEQVAQLAATIEPRWSALVLTAAWAGLRFGEAQRLARADVDLLHGTVRVLQAKTSAGVRTVHLPKQLVAVLERHLCTFAGPELVFVGDRGGALSKNFTRREFRSAADSLGFTSLHFHDLRHYAGTMTAVSGATQREIMARLGHASPAAALRYQHAAESRAAETAAALDALFVPATGGGNVRNIRS
jgi:integrase